MGRNGCPDPRKYLFSRFSGWCVNLLDTNTLSARIGIPVKRNFRGVIGICLCEDSEPDIIISNYKKVVEFFTIIR